MSTRDQERVIEDWLRRTRKTVRTILRDAGRIVTLAGPYTFSFLECRRRPPFDVVSPLLAIDREWDRCHRPPKPRRRAKHPMPREIALMSPRDRHFAKWDRERRDRIKLKRAITSLTNGREEIGEEQFQRWLNDPDPKFDFVRRADEALRRGKEIRDRSLNN
jgi:hypothetical protein